MATNRTLINDRSPVTKVSGGTVLTFPDVCKTPSPGGPVPVPYPNVAKSAALADGSATVTIDGAPVCLKGSKLATSTGDEAGSLGGVVSGKVKGKATPVTWSSNVFIEGQPVVLNGDLFVSNNKNTAPAPIVQEQVGPAEEAARPSPADIPEGLAEPNDKKVDPGAVPGPPVELEAHPPPVCPEGWPPIPLHKTTTFDSTPEPVELPAGTPVYRVIGADPNFGTSRYDGEFWSLEPLPATEAEWRRDYAVLLAWNGDGGYVRHVLEQPVKVWKGPTGPQNSKQTGHVLAGGKMQFWVPIGAINPLEGGKTKCSVTNRTPWNEA